MVTLRCLPRFSDPGCFSIGVRPGPGDSIKLLCFFRATRVSIISRKWPNDLTKQYIFLSVFTQNFNKNNRKYINT